MNTHSALVRFRGKEYRDTRAVRHCTRKTKDGDMQLMPQANEYQIDKASPQSRRTVTA